MVLQKYDTNVQPFSYVIYKDGSIIKAVNGTTGAVDYSGTNAASVINNTLNNLTVGRTWKERVILKGSFDIGATILVHSYTILDLYGAKITPTGNFTGVKTTDSTDVDILGGIIDGINQTRDYNLVRGVSVGNADRLLMKGLEVKNGGYYGINLLECTNCTLDHIYSHDNTMSGIHLGADTVGKNLNNQVINSRCDNNGRDGINDRGSRIAYELLNNNYINNIASNNAHYGFTFANNGSIVASPISKYFISNCRAFGNNDGGFFIQGCRAMIVNPIAIGNSGGCGMNMAAVNGVTMTNPLILNNNQTGVDAGIKFIDSSGVSCNKISILGGEIRNNSYNIRMITSIGIDDIKIAYCDITNGVNANLSTSGTITNLKIKNVSGYVTESNVLSGTFAIDSTGIKTVTIPHGLAITPAVQDCYLTVVENTIVDDWAYNLLKIASTDAKNVLAKINVSTVSKTIGATARLALRVGNP